MLHARRAATAGQSEFRSNELKSKGELLIAFCTRGRGGKIDNFKIIDFSLSRSMTCFSRKRVIKIGELLIRSKCATCLPFVFYISPLNVRCLQVSKCGVQLRNREDSASAFLKLNNQVVE